MFKAVSRVLVVAMIFFAFFGQAIAYSATMSCETSVDSHSASNYSELVNHNYSNATDTGSSTHCCDIECCDADCICIANACSSFAYLNAEVGSVKAVVLYEAVYIQQFEQPKSITTLLFRPPIFVS